MMTSESKPVLLEGQINLLRLKYFNRSNDAAYVFDFESGRILDANEYTLRMLGYTRDELLQLDVFDIHPEEERQRMIELIEIFAREDQVRGISDMHLKKKDGSWIPVEKNGSLFELGERKVVQCTCRDITERKIFETELNKRVEDMHILNSIALEITSGLELEQLLPRITQNAVELLDADAGATGLYDPRRGSLSYRYLYNLPDTLASIEIPRSAGLTSFVLETGNPISIPDYLEYPKAIEEFKSAGIRAVAIAPLRIEDKLLGTLVVTHKNADKRFNEYDIGLLEAVSRQAAIAIYNAQLFEEMRDEGEFREALNQLTSLIGSTLDLDKIYNLICKESTRLFKNSGTYLYIADKDRGLLAGKAAYGEKDDEFLKVSIPLREPSLASYIYHTRKPLLIDDVRTNPLVKPEILQKFSSQTLMGTPIIVDDEVKSVLVFASSERPFFFSDVQLDRAQILSSQVAFAIKNANLYEQTKNSLERERYIAITLQQSLFPGEIPEINGAEVGAYYAPMHEGNSLVGGDFYDFTLLADGKVAIFIGDVSGKGIEAAATTAMVKYAIRSFMYKNPTPSSVLTHANNVVSMQLKASSFVTICYALYDPETGKLSLANAGHPYPLYCPAEDELCSLIETGNPAFGLVSNYAYDQIERTLEKGDILALYTDGLIEARFGREFYGIERAMSSVDASRGLAAQGIAAQLVRDCEKFSNGNFMDDVAILVLKRV